MAGGGGMSHEKRDTHGDHEDERARHSREGKLKQQILDERAVSRSNLAALLPSVREVPSDFEGCVW
jgi:hypothetical protein